MTRRITTVRFLKAAGIYRTGDVAGFPGDVARAYVERGLVEVVERDVPEVAPDVEAHDSKQRDAALQAMRDQFETASAPAPSGSGRRDR